jgi:hypothetical protein
MEFIDRSLYGIQDCSFITNQLLLDIVDSEIKYQICLTEKINLIVNIPDNLGKMMELKKIPLFNLLMTNDVDLIQETFTQIFRHNHYGTYIYTIRFILRFCNLEVIQLLMEGFNFKPKISLAVSCYKYLEIICERHDDNVEILEYFIRIGSQYFGNDVRIKMKDIFISAANHSNIKIFRGLYSYYIVEQNNTFIRNQFKENFVDKYLNFPIDIIDFLFDENYLNGRTTLKSIYFILDNLYASKEHCDKLKYVVELINEGKIILSNNEIDQLKQRADKCNSNYRNVLKELI